MSKYKSDDPAIEKALRQTNTLVGIPFMVVLMSSMFGGLALVDYLELPGWVNVISIFGGIALTGLVAHSISVYWFKKHIALVSDKEEFLRRAIRLKMMLPNTAAKLAAPYLLSDSNFASSPIRNVDFGNDVRIQSGRLYIDDEFYQISMIRNFSIHHTGSGLPAKSELYLKLLDGKSKRIRVNSSIITELEYELDKQIEFYKNQE